MTITIVGVLGPITDGIKESADLQACMRSVEQAIYQHFPHFVPAYPPVVITVVSLPELRSNDA